METLARALFALSLLGIGLIVAVFVFPEAGGGAAPPPSSSLLGDAVTNPLVLGGFALSLVLGGLSLGGQSKPMTSAVSPTLAPLPEGLSPPKRLALTRAAVTAVVTPSSTGEQLLDVLIEAASRCDASDIHVQPTREGATVSFRVDGSLEPVVSVSPEAALSLTNRLKVVSRVVHFKSDAPQDGQFSQSSSLGRVEVRLSLLPTQHGEKAVLRLTGLGRRQPTLDDLGLTVEERRQLERFLGRPQGMLFFTGPTGSGKTTSIYGALHQLKVARGGKAQIASIEDPIELTLPEAAQTQVNRASGLDFASGLRAILRQDPNIIVVGEIRDAETAGIAIQAGLTGHLILTTVHADSSAGVFNRLLEMGVEPSILASVSLASISQRLVRKLCPACRQPKPPTAEQAQRLAAAGLSGSSFFVAGACEECGSTGFVGRVPVFEVLEMSEKLREALRTNPSTQRLLELARSEGMVPLLDAAVARAAAGVTTLDEAFRVAG